MPSFSRSYTQSYTFVPYKTYLYGALYRSDPLVTVDYTDRKHMASWNDVISRPKPSDLINYQTALPVQSTTRYTAAIYLSSSWRWSGAWSWETITLIAKTWDASLSTNYPSTQWATKARLRVKNRKISLGETLAEYRQSANMFGSFAKRSVEAWRSFKGKPGNRHRKITPCSVNSAYLMSTYGLHPLAGVLYDSIEELYLRLGMPLHHRFCVTDGRGGSESIDYHPYTLNIVRNISERAIFHVQYNTLGRSSAFSFGNPAQIAWELVPYSFVLDWALPIGDYLAALDALTGVSWLKGTLTTKRRASYRADFTQPWPVAGVTLTNLRSPSGSYESHSRDLISTIPMPDLPQWRPSPSYRKVVNGLSLIGNILNPCKGKHRPRLV